MKKHLITLTIMTVISGCTINGHEEFTCPNPEKGICMPAEEAYEAAEAGRDANSTSFALDNQDEAGEKHAVQNNYRDVAPVIGVMSVPLSQPKPVLEPAKVLKAWVNAWESEFNVLHMPQTAYVEITPRRWNLAESNVQKFKSSSPFKRVVKPSQQ